MMLVEETGVPTAAWPVAAFRDHLRLGTGFADEAVQDAVLERLLRAASGAVERRTGKVLLERSFLWTLNAWRGYAKEELPVGPVTSITELRILSADGVVSVISPVAYGLEPDTHRPVLAARSLGLPTVPVGGLAEIAFDAGFAADWSGVPDDLAQAVFLLAAHYHENRHETAGGATMPHGVEALIAPWRPMRLFGRRR
ncbi:MAG: head-tail connector protein [Pseudomonadota bacterium]